MGLNGIFAQICYSIFLMPTGGNAGGTKVTLHEENQISPSFAAHYAASSCSILRAQENGDARFLCQIHGSGEVQRSNPTRKVHCLERQGHYVLCIFSYADYVSHCDVCASIGCYGLRKFIAWVQLRFWPEQVGCPSCDPTMPAPHSREVNFTEADHGCSQSIYIELH
jgi:hypothetical protein